METMSQIVIEADRAAWNVYDDFKLRLSICDLYFRQQSSKNYYVEELTMIREQTELLQKINERVSTKTLDCETFVFDRELTQDAEITTTLTQVKSTGNLCRRMSPNNSFVSNQTTVLSRGSSNGKSKSQLMEEVKAKCSTEAVKTLQKIINQNNRGKDSRKEIQSLKGMLARAKQEIEIAKQKEIQLEAKLYETNKKIKAAEVALVELKDRKEELQIKQSELETRQIRLNKAEVACMVRQKMSKSHQLHFSEWVQ